MNTQYLSGTGTPVKGFLKKRIQNTVLEYISNRTAEGRFLVCTDMEGNPRQLFLQQLHKTVTRNRSLYICGGDFTDPDGGECAIHFTVAGNDDGLYVKEAEVKYLFTDDRQSEASGAGILKVA